VKQKGNNLIFETKLFNSQRGKNETVTLQFMANHSGAGDFKIK
jgi:hypothetical protein